MPRVVWSILFDRPRVEVVFLGRGSAPSLVRSLLADTGAGSLRDPFDLLLDANDCAALNGRPVGTVVLQGAYKGTCTVFRIPVEIPLIGFHKRLLVVGIVPRGDFPGVACFRFLNLFTYGNFGDPASFGLEV